VNAGAAAVGRLRALSVRARIGVSVAVVVLAGVGAGGWYAARDVRTPLFATALRPDQLAEVEARLAAWDVPYAVLADNVRVDPGRRSGLLLRLALAGVPHPHLAGSDEALAHVGALTPQTILEAQTRDALAADLALGLRGLDGVADARVVIAPSSAGIYADDARRDASASVRVELAPGARLSARSVAGIKAFIAGGVPGLDASRVTVVDDRGVALGGDDSDDVDDVQTSLQSALDAAFGARATIVRVHRETVGEQRDVRDVRRDAIGGTIARASTDERYASGAKHYSKQIGNEDRGSDTREEHRVIAPDATARLSVAVFVDAARALDLEKIRALAAATAGIGTERGDTLRVEAVTFDDAPASAPGSPAPGWLLAAASVLPQALTALAVVAIAAFGAKPCATFGLRMLEAQSARRAAREAQGIPPARMRGVLDGEPPHVAAAIISALPTATAAAVLELYPPEERTAIVRRLARANATLVPPAEELLRARG
jgi:flagellar biosynthesis/type III secretory pathway M-ring protein FliF/YscJ